MPTSTPHAGWSLPIIALMLLALPKATAEPSTAISEVSVAATDGPQVVGLVHDATGAPLAGVRVTLHAAMAKNDRLRRWLEGEAPNVPLATTQTDTAGKYQLALPAEGPLSVEVHLPGFLPVRTTRVLVGASTVHTLPTARLVTAVEVTTQIGADPGASSSTQSQALWLLAKAHEGTPDLGTGWLPYRPPVSLTAGSTVRLPRARQETLDLVLATPGAAILDRARVAADTAQRRRGSAATVELSPQLPLVDRQVWVVDESNQPLAGVLLADRRGPSPLGVTDAQGQATLRLPETPGLLRLVAHGPGGASWNTHLPTFPPDLVLSDENRRTASTLELAQSHGIEGRVLDARGRPVHGAWVVPNYDPGRAVRTDAAGRWQATTTPAEVSRQFLAPGFAPATVSLRKPLTQPLDVRLAAAKPRQGRVVALDGQGIAGALIQARTEGARSLAPALTLSDAEGRFALATGSAAGRVLLRAEHPNFAPGATWIDPAVQTQMLTLEPRRSGFGRVFDLDERPVVGARVEVWGEGLERTTQRAVSGPEGQWTVALVPPGRLTLRVQAEGYAPLVIRGVTVPANQQSPEVDAVDLGTLIVEPGHRLTGWVVDSEGELVGGARLRLTAPGVDGAREVTTDPQGAFSLAGLPSTQALLHVTADGFAPARLPAVPVPSETPPTLRLTPAASLVGRVVDGSGAPVAGAEVTLRGRTRRTGRHQARAATASLDATLTSRADGRFVFGALPSGPAEVVAQAPGFRDSDPVPVTLEPRHTVEGIELVLRSGLTVRGRVQTTSGRPVPAVQLTLDDRRANTDAEGRFHLDGLAPGPAEVVLNDPRAGRQRWSVTITPELEPLLLEVPEGHGVRGEVLDASGRGIAAARVQVHALDRGGQVVARVESEAEGHFVASGFAPGTYRLAAEHPEHGFTQLEVVLDVAAEGLVAAGDALWRDGLQLVLEPSATISGNLLGLDDDDLAAAEVTARHPDLGRRHGRVDYTGRYQLDRLAPGPWQITAVVPHRGRFAETRVVVQPSDTVERDLDFTGSTLRGTARFLGEPIAAARLDLRGLDQTLERQAIADPEGRFELTDLAPGRYRVQVVSRRLALTYHRDVEVLGDLDVDLDVEPVTLEGQVVDADGLPLADTALRLEHRPEHGPAGSVLTLSTDAEGLFQVDHLAPGKHHLGVRRDGFEPFEQLLELGQEPIATVRLQLVPSAGLILRVAAPPSQRTRWLTVAVLANGEVERLEAQPLDPSGEVRFDTLPPGSLRLLVRLPGTVATEVAATVPGPPVEVTLRPAAAVDVWVPELAESDRRAWLSVVGADGQPFATLDDRGLWRRQWPVADGRAAIEGLPAGTWTVRVEATDGRAWQELVASTPGGRVTLQL